MPINPISAMDTFAGSSPAIDAYNRIAGLAAVLNIKTKTASYTCTVEDSGTVFDTTGASGAVTFTLPAETNTGCFFIFKNTVDQNMVVTAASGKLVALHNAAATSVTYSTSGQKIGAACLVVCDGAKWHAMNISAGVQAVTVA